MVVGKQEEAQKGQFNLKCLSLVYQLLRFKRPGQLELSDFCHFDLFLFLCCNVYFNAARLLSLSVCSGGVGRSSWRGGAGIIKPCRGTSGTPLSAIRGSSQRMLMFLGPANAQSGLFSIGT